jgi:hypothetical protein
MRRTATMVLVPLLFLVLAAIGSASLPAQAATASSRRPAHSKPASHHAPTRRTVGHHPNGKSASHPTTHPAKRAAMHPASRASVCPPLHPRIAAARKRRACAAIDSRPQKVNARPLQVAEAKTPEPLQAPAVDDAKPDGNPSEDIAAADPEPEPTTQPASFRWKRNVMPPPMRGSLESLERQNQMADEEGLERIEDEEDLADRIAHKLLVPVPASAALTVNGNLPENHRYCRPWTARFLADLARAHAAQFHSSFEVSSAVRTVAYQKRLMTENGNAAAAEGDVVSPHLTGATIDIAKSGMTRQEIGWMRSWLMPLQTADKIDVEEEFQQACFHITVYKSYVPPKPAAPQQKATPSKTRQLNRDLAAAAPALGR